MSRSAAALLFLVLIGTDIAYAQLPRLRGYYLNVGLWSGSTKLTRGGLADLQRLRFMSQKVLGPSSLEVAYEHLFSYTENAGSGVSGALVSGVAPSGGEWLDLQWTIEESNHVTWRHRVDRLNLAVTPGDFIEAKLGRQTISWATTLLLTPADPFTPFDPADPFREYRAGVDALRVRAFPGPLSEAEAVLRPSDTPVGETLTLLGRGRGVWLGWEVSAWAGVLHDEAALGLGASGALGQAALRGEASLREENDDLILRGTAGVDTRLDAFGRDLYLVFEYQHDEFGASEADELVEVANSDPFARGELQVLSQDVAVGQALYQLHPLWSGGLLIIWSLSDGSPLISPSISYSVSDEATTRVGLFLGLGDDTVTGEGELGSEFGVVPTIFYLSLSLFF